MDLTECKQSGFIKTTSPSKEHAQSLIEMSKINENVVTNSAIDEINISVYFSLAYESLREVLEAFCIMHGFKVTNHLCLGELVRSLHIEFDFTLFDRVRYMRNGVNYYGEKVDYEQGLALIKKIFELKRKIQTTINS